MKIVIAGGSGQVGTMLARYFASEGHEVVILTRRPSGMSEWRQVGWDGEMLGPWMKELDGSDVLINMVGRSVNCRYTGRNRNEIIASRLRSVRVLAEAVRRCASPPRTWLQASTATIYAHRLDAANDEPTGIMGGLEEGAPETWRFSIDVASAWENNFEKEQTPGTRKVLLRSAITMSPDKGGTFRILLGLTRLGLGGKAGSGKQYMSWIHEYDFVRAVSFLIKREDIEGAVNLSSPNPITNNEFMRTLRRTCGIPFGFPALTPLLEIAAFVHRTESELLLKSRRVIPGRLSALGFSFRYPNWEDAAAELCSRARNASRQSMPRIIVDESIRHKL